MVYKIDTPGLQDQAVTDDKIDTATISISRLSSEVSGALVPIGGIILWSGTADALAGFPNWQLCDGSAITSGTLSGSNTPNLVNRFVIGTGTYDDTGAEWQTDITGSDTQTGGSKDAIVVDHNHTLTDDGHSHSITQTDHTHTSNLDGYNVQVSGGAFSMGPGSQGATRVNNFAINGASANITIDSGTTGITIDSAGSAGTNQNLPPYYALAYIIRIN